MTINIILAIILIGVICWYSYIKYQTHNIIEYHNRDVRAYKIKKSKRSCLNACKERMNLVNQYENTPSLIDIPSLKTKIENLIVVLQSPKNTDMSMAYNKLKEIDTELLILLSSSLGEESYE